MKWSGKLTIENMEEVVEKFRKFLNARKYTFVSTIGGRHISVKTSQEVKHEKSTISDAFGTWYDDKNNPPAYAGFNVCDTYGVWGLSTSPGDEPYIMFDWNQVTIEHKNGYGEKLVWIIALEKQHDE